MNFTAILWAERPYRIGRDAYWVSAAKSLLVGICVALLFATTACHVQFVSSYDETTDTLAKELQTKIDRQFQSWIRMPAGSPGLRYDDKANLEFYAEVSADISVLQARAKAQPLNQITVSMLDTVKDSVDQIEAFHKANQTISAAALANAQGQIDFQLQRIIAFELAKKRGETPKA
jgi:hypothetical protein